MKALLPLALLTALPLCGQAVLRPQVPRPPAAAEAESRAAASGTTFHSKVHLVNVLATVTDQHGAPVGGLEKQDFRLYEDGVEQQVSIFERQTELPLSIVLGIDASLSTRKDLPLELQSAKKFAQTILRPADGLALYEFDDTVSELEPFTSDLKKIDKAMGSLHPGAATALYDAIYLASKALFPRQGRKVMVLITDGGDTASATNYQEALRAAQISESLIYSIIMVPIEADAGRDLGGEHALIQLSEDTGGRYYYATDLAQLDSAFRQIGDELRTQYLLAYYPSQKNGNEFHALRLELTRKAADGSAYKALYRRGYYASRID